MRTTRLVGDVPAAEGDVDIQNDVNLNGLSRMASAALGHDQPAVPSEVVEEREEEEVPLRRKRSAYRRARTEFSTPAFEQFQANLSAGGLPHTAVSESAGPFVTADKGKAPMPDLDIPAEFLAEDAQARKRFEEEQACERLVQQLQAEDLAQEDLPIVSEQRAKELDKLMLRKTEIDWLNLMMQVGSNPTLARELLGADVTEDNFIERMTTIKEKKKRALADLRYRALKGKPMKQSEVTQMMRNLVKNQWCAAHNGTITMTAVKAMTKQQLIEEYEYICRRLEKDRLLSAQYNLFRPKPAITEPPSETKGFSSNPAASATPMAGSAASNPAGGTFDATGIDSTVPTTAALDFAGSRREIGVPRCRILPDSSSRSNVLFESTSGDPDWMMNSACGDSFRGRPNILSRPPHSSPDWNVPHSLRTGFPSSHRSIGRARFCCGHVYSDGHGGLRPKRMSDAFCSYLTWLHSQERVGYTLQTALVCNSNPLIASKGLLNNPMAYHHPVLCNKSVAVQEGPALGLSKRLSTDVRSLTMDVRLIASVPRVHAVSLLLLFWIAVLLVSVACIYYLLLVTLYCGISDADVFIIQSSTRNLEVSSLKEYEMLHSQPSELSVASALYTLSSSSKIHSVNQQYHMTFPFRVKEKKSSSAIGLL
ncbi:hypothetical protein Tco_0781473 [Tanacetum coccineum]